MIIMPRNKKWSDLTARQKAPFVLRGIVQFALLAAALADIYHRPAEDIRGDKWLWVAAAFVNFMASAPSPISSSGGSVPSVGLPTRKEKR